MNTASPVSEPAHLPPATPSAHAETTARQGAAELPDVAAAMVAAADPGPEASGGASPDSKNAMRRRRRIPLSHGAGLALIAGGVAGVILPGIPGFPLLILGAAVLAPSVPALARANEWVQDSFPEVYDEALNFADRFAADFEKRFPSEKPPEPPAG
ncbi:hypothetical protein DB346_18150 [Verrucomicrobia bacterium LW23]|nr:hypothetical protein DB346_18150 [Verrucomicrobia bacterium LW23]